MTATVSYAPKDLSDQPTLLDSQLVFDTNLHGFTPLFTPEGIVDADIIALAGLVGHAYGSWALSTERMWLRDFLPVELPRCRVLTYGYDSRHEVNGSIDILFHYSNNFNVKLHNMRRQG